jgi:hypothetical protein
MNASSPRAASRQFAPTRFSGKVWILAAQFAIFGSLSAQALIAGPLFLTGIMKTADRRPGTDAGIALTLIGVLLAPVAALFLFNILARRRPLLYLCQEGIVVNLIGVSSLDGLPVVPGFSRAIALLRVAWLIVSLQGFKQQLVYAPWHGFQAAQVSGLRMQRKLAVFANFFRPAPIGVQPEFISDQLWFAEVEFTSSLEQIARSITIYSTDVRARQQLPSWQN